MGKVWSGAPGRRDGQGPGRSDTCSSGLSPGFPRAEVSSQECVRSEGSVCSVYGVYGALWSHVCLKSQELE